MLLVIKFIELVAAITGSFYLRKHKINFPIKSFVYFLWFTVFVEIIGMLPRAILHLDFFSFLKGTFLAKNHWLYNVYDIINFVFFIFFFSAILKNRNFKIFLRSVGWFYLVSTVFNIYFFDLFFVSNSVYSYILGTFLIVTSVGLYFYEMLQSDEILNFNKSIYFYISVGAIIFHIIICPLLIYDEYFDLGKSPEFVEIRRFILICANIFLYTCYTIGFLICLKKNKSY